MSAAPEPFMTDQIHLMVATPCFGGQVSSIYAGSVFHLQRAVRSKPSMDLTILMRDGDALITRARANLVTLFLDNPSATRLLFVDADIGFTLDYVLEIDDPDRVVTVDGFTRVRFAGTGFLMIRRHVLERMCQHPAYASLRFFNEHSFDALAGSRNRFALFECMIDPKTGTYLSEDFAFCKRWTDIGGEIWADLESRLDHVGPSVFHGDVSSQFAAPASIRAANAA